MGGKAPNWGAIRRGPGFPAVYAFRLVEVALLQLARPGAKKANQFAAARFYQVRFPQTDASLLVKQGYGADKLPGSAVVGGLFGN